MKTSVARLRVAMRWDCGILPVALHCDGPLCATQRAIAFNT